MANIKIRFQNAEITDSKSLPETNLFNFGIIADIEIDFQYEKLILRQAMLLYFSRKLMSAAIRQSFSENEQKHFFDVFSVDGPGRLGTFSIQRVKDNILFGHDNRSDYFSPRVRKVIGPIQFPAFQFNPEIGEFHHSTVRVARNIEVVAGFRPSR